MMTVLRETVNREIAIAVEEYKRTHRRSSFKSKNSKLNEVTPPAENSSTESALHMK